MTFVLAKGELIEALGALFIEEVRKNQNYQFMSIICSITYDGQDTKDM